MYTIERTTSSGKTTKIKTVETLRKAQNCMDWTQENSSKSSTITLLCNLIIVETRRGLN
jgi:hypothetical protein